LRRPEPPIRIRWGGEDEKKQAAADRPTPAVRPVPGLAEPLPHTQPSPAAQPPGVAVPTTVAGGEDASRPPIKVYLPPPNPAPEPKESLAKGGESGQMTAPSSIPKTDPKAPSAITQSRTAETKAAEPQIFENEQKAIQTEGSGLFDAGGFPMGDYASVIIERVKGNWFIPSNLRNSQGRTTVIFFIARDGRFTDARIVATSGSSSLDLAALNAIIGSNPFPPLPRGFPGERVGAKFIFAYNERQ